MKQCLDCQRESIGPKPLTEFYKDRTTKLAHGRYCKLHVAARRAIWYAKHRHRELAKHKIRNQRPEIKQHHAAYAKRRNAENPSLRLLQDARRRARKAGLPCNLTIEDVSIPAMCPVLNIPILRPGGKTCNNSPSVDRIIPELGYVRGNVQVISYMANAMKRNATIDQLLTFANWVLTMFTTQQQRKVA